MNRFLKKWFVLLILTAPVSVFVVEAKAGMVAVLLSSNNSIYETTLTGLRISLAEHNLDVQYLDGDEITGAGANPAAYFRKLNGPEIDLVVAIGPAAAGLAVENVREKTVLITMVPALRQMTAGDRPVCGVITTVPIALYFATLREISKSARDVVAFYSTGEAGFVAAEGEYFDVQHGFQYRRKQISPGDFADELRAQVGRADAFYMVADPMFDRERFEKLSNFARDNGVVLMAGFAPLVSLGATFGYSPDYHQIGLLTGAMGERILSGASTCAAEGLRAPERSAFLFYVNEEYARASGVDLPPEIVQRARTVRLVRAGVQLFQEGKFNSSRSIFTAILKHDPENPTARYYVNAISNEVNGEKLRALMKSAEQAFADRDYVRASSLYEQVLKINPNATRAREGRVAAGRALSEQQRQQAAVQSRQGQAYPAIRQLQSALQSWPENQAARRDLADLRASLRGRLAADLREGVAAYDRRAYAEAIDIFQNILLVEPGHRQAAEYLRLSRLKFDALQRLRRDRARDSN